MNQKCSAEKNKCHEGNFHSKLVRSLTWINKVNETCQVMQQVIIKIRPKAINTSLSGENLVRQDKKEKSEPFMKDEITSTFSHYKNKKSSFRELQKSPIFRGPEAMPRGLHYRIQRRKMNVTT